MSESESKTYGVFLSYAHKDAEEYGEHYIMKIKEAIEEAIEDVAGDHSKVFLDTSALKEGDLWQSKIIKKMRECYVFLCLVSENYKKSQNCARERIWWSRREIQRGRLLKDTYPIYYVKLDDGLFSDKQPTDIRNLASLQKEDPEPWFGEDIGDAAHQANNFKRRLKFFKMISGKK
jgi:hypothetical protein